VELVTADGSCLHVSESTEPNLFWAIRGGGGNFGIVTQFEFRLHEMNNEMLSGQVMYPFADARTVLQAFREVMLKAPDELVCYPCFFRIPPIPAFPESLHGQVVISLVIGYTGDIEEGKSVVQPLREIAEPIADTMGIQSWVTVNQMFDPGVPYGMRWYTQAHDMDTLSDEAIDTTIQHAETLQGAFTFAYFDSLGCAISRVPSNKTAYAGRDAQFGFHVLAGWIDGEEDAALINWAKAFHRDMEPFGNGGVYVNLLAEDEKDRIPAAYGANLPRLREIKKKWDPENLFRGNHNIAPD